MVEATAGAAKKPAKQFETYKKVSTLGVGSFGTAYMVQCMSDNSYAVIKQIDIAQMSEEFRPRTFVVPDLGRNPVTSIKAVPIGKIIVKSSKQDLVRSSLDTKPGFMMKHH